MVFIGVSHEIALNCARLHIHYHQKACGMHRDRNRDYAKKSSCTQRVLKETDHLGRGRLFLGNSPLRPASAWTALRTGIWLPIRPVRASGFLLENYTPERFRFVAWDARSLSWQILSRLFCTVLKLSPVESDSIRIVCSMLPTIRVWSITFASALPNRLARGPASPYLVAFILFSSKVIWCSLVFRHCLLFQCHWKRVQYRYQWTK